MKAARGMVRPVLLAWLLYAAAGAEVTPVQKVLDMLQGMLARGKQEKDAEQVQYASYKQFCVDTSTQTTRDIAEASEKIDMLTADSEKATSDAELLTHHIAAHEEDIAVWNGDIKAATRVREIEKGDYTALHQDFSESIDALKRAIAVLREQAHDRKQAAAFAQVSALMRVSLIPAEAKQSINAFLEQGQSDLDDGSDGLAVTPPEAYGYEFQSHGIVDMLEKLVEKFSSERARLEKGEMNSQHAFEVLVQDLNAAVGQATHERNRKSDTKAAKLEAKAKAEADKADTMIARSDDQKYLKDVTTLCDKKASDFESRQALRTSEIEAIEKAIEIISSSSVSGNADAYLPTLIQTHSQRAPSFAGLRADAQNANQAQAALYLRDRARSLNSRLLAALAQRVSSDPFSKVKKMLRELIAHLMEEAGDESDHKSWCDAELATNEQTRKEKTDGVEMAHARCDELKASLAQLANEISDLNQAVAALEAAMADATTMRQKEKAENAQTVADAQDSQTAVKQALLVLEEFYAKAGEATALLQRREPQLEAPKIFDTAYKGMQDEGTGVIGMLQVILSDFSRLESETLAAEATSQREYEAFVADSKADRSQKQKDVEHRIAKKQDAGQDLNVAQGDLEQFQNELEASLQYFNKLKPSCVDSTATYDDRVSRREEEIASLHETLDILNGKDIAAA